MDNYDIVLEEFRSELEKDKAHNHNNLTKKELIKLNKRYDKVIEEEFLDLFVDPQYNYDFTNKNDKIKFIRGGYEYKRPLGWKRYGLDVEFDYEDNDWIKSKDWPVAYHGTKIENVESIVIKGFDLSKGKRFRYGKGIYCTPNIQTAERYSTVFKSETTKKNYKIVLQVRVNKDSIEKKGIDYWLIKDEIDIRPYGILIKEIN